MFKRLHKYWKLKKSADKLIDEINKDRQMKKNIFKSKTFWINLLAVLNEVLKFFPETNSGILIPTEVVAAGLPVANIVLRRLTSEPVQIIPESKIRANW